MHYQPNEEGQAHVEEVQTSVRGSASGFSSKQLFNLFKGGPRQREVAIRAQCQVRELHAIGDAVGYEKDEAGISDANLSVPDCRDGLLDGKLLGALRWLRKSKRAGTILYALSFVMDAAVREDMAGVQEHLALLYVAIEQANLDQGRWDLAFQFLLLDDPPSQLWSYNRTGNPMSSGRARAFAPLCPQRWATVSLAFLKELDSFQNRRVEMGKKAQPAQVEDPPGPPSPKRKRFPKPKGGGGGADSSSTAASSNQ